MNGEFVLTVALAQVRSLAWALEHKLKTGA